MTGPLRRGARGPAAAAAAALVAGSWLFRASCVEVALEDAAAAALEGAEVCAAAGEAGCAGSTADGDDPALTLRQLRATARHEQAKADPAPPQETDSSAADEDGDAPVDNEDGAEDAGDDEETYDAGLPGGWGEAADFIEEAAQEEHEDLDGKNASLQSQVMLWGSCARYHCPSYYVRRHGCQCYAGCERHGRCCHDYRAKCHRNQHHYHQHHSSPAPAPAKDSGHHGQVLTLYHQTGPGIGPLILKNGFKPGTQGWCGGGIYFATSPGATNTKAIGPDSHKGYLLEAKVDVGRVMFKGKTCDRSLNAGKVLGQHYDSVSFNPGDGQEYIVYSNSRIHSIRHISMR